MAEGWPIGEVAAKLRIDADTLRYYERREVVPRPDRDAAGHRAYTENDVHLLEVLLHLRATGMPLARIAEFTRLVASDPDGVPERLALLQQHREHVISQIEAWNDSLTVIDGKVRDYSQRVGHD